MHTQRPVVDVPAGVDPPALHGHARAALDLEVELEDVRGGIDGRRRIAVLLHHVRRDIAGHVVVYEMLGGSCSRNADHRRQWLVRHGNSFGHIFGDVSVGGDDHSDRLADVVDLVLGQAVAGPGVRERRMRDEHRQRVGDRAIEIVVGVDRDQAVDVKRRGDVDVDDAGMTVRAADERDRSAS